MIVSFQMPVYAKALVYFYLTHGKSLTAFQSAMKRDRSLVWYCRRSLDESVFIGGGAYFGISVGALIRFEYQQLRGVYREGKDEEELLISDLFLPDCRYGSIENIEAEVCRENHFIRYILCDIDNTLVSYREAHPDKRVLDFIKRMQDGGVQLALVSNASKKRVMEFNKDLGLPAVYRAGKPLGFGIRKAMRMLGAKRKETAVLGDQLFTDIWASKLARCKISYIVDPIDPEAETSYFFKLKRKLENFLLWGKEGE